MIPQVPKRWVLRVCDMGPIVKDNLWYQRSYKVKVRKFKGVLKDYFTVWFGDKKIRLKFSCSIVY